MSVDIEDLTSAVQQDPDVGSSVVTLINKVAEALDGSGSKKAIADALTENANEIADAVLANTASADTVVVDPTNPTGEKRSADGVPIKELDVTGTTAGDEGNSAHSTVAGAPALETSGLTETGNDDDNDDDDADAETFKPSSESD